MTRMCDLPSDLVGHNILTRIPITSLRAVRSTCKLWDALTKEWVLGKAAAAKEQFLGFMTKDSKVCSVRFHLCLSKDEEDEEDLLDLSIKEVDLLNEVKISRVFHCEGLLLCVDKYRLMVWNPYLGQTKWIEFRTLFPKAYCYALGYDIDGNHKILSFLVYLGGPRYEIYEFSSNLWRVLNVTTDWKINHYQGSVSVKGNTYFIAHDIEPNEDGMIDKLEVFLVCFDFTTERFRQLSLPFYSCRDETVALSCIREEKLAILYFCGCHNSCNIVQIWVTTRIEPNYVSWSKFLRVEMKPFPITSIWFKDYKVGNFSIDEEQKVAVVFTVYYHKVFIIGEDGYFKSVSHGVVPKVAERSRLCWPISKMYYPPCVRASSYRPSLVQVNQQR